MFQARREFGACRKRCFRARSTEILLDNVLSGAFGVEVRWVWPEGLGETLRERRAPPRFVGDVTQSLLLGGMAGFDVKQPFP